MVVYPVFTRKAEPCPTRTGGSTFFLRISASAGYDVDAVEWDFFCSNGRKSGEWSTIPVPSNWEQHGFGGYDYGHVAPNEKHDETGRYGLWENDYNDGITGVNWIVPEFKGIFSTMDWMRIDLKSGSSILVETEPGSDVGVLRPRNGAADEAASPKRTVWDDPPEGGLFLFHKVPAVGTKFKEAAALGPRSEPERLAGPLQGLVGITVR